MSTEIVDTSLSSAELWVVARLYDDTNPQVIAKSLRTTTGNIMMSFDSWSFINAYVGDIGSVNCGYAADTDPHIIRGTIDYQKTSDEASIFVDEVPGYLRTNDIDDTSSTMRMPLPFYLGQRADGSHSLSEAFGEALLINGSLST